MSEKKAFETWWAQHGTGNMNQQYLAWQAALEWAKSQQEPVAHIFPSDLEKFETQETFAYAYSVIMGSPTEKTVPLYTAPAVEINGRLLKALKNLMLNQTAPSTDKEMESWTDALLQAEAAIEAAERGRV